MPVNGAGDGHQLRQRPPGRSVARHDQSTKEDASGPQSQPRNSARGMRIVRGPAAYAGNAPSSARLRIVRVEQRAIRAASAVVRRSGVRVPPRESLTGRTLVGRNGQQAGREKPPRGRLRACETTRRKGRSWRTECVTRVSTRRGARGRRERDSPSSRSDATAYSSRSRSSTARTRATYPRGASVSSPASRRARSRSDAQPSSGRRPGRTSPPRRLASRTPPIRLPLARRCGARVTRACTSRTSRRARTPTPARTPRRSRAASARRRPSRSHRARTLSEVSSSGLMAWSTYWSRTSRETPKSHERTPLVSPEEPLGSVRR